MGLEVDDESTWDAMAEGCAEAIAKILGTIYWRRIDAKEGAPPKQMQGCRLVRKRKIDSTSELELQFADLMALPASRRAGSGTL